MKLKHTATHLLALFVISCTSKSKIQIPANCFIKYDSLFAIVDTSNLEIIRGTDSAAIEVLDKKTKNGERGLLRFDENNNLRFYAFLTNENNDASFFLKIDSVGNRVRESTNEVVQWTFYTQKDSTIKFTFLLCAMDRNYGDITIRAGKFKKENITLYESNFTKLICATISMDGADLDSTRKIYIEGRWGDKCSKKEQTFIDSTTAP